MAIGRPTYGIAPLALLGVIALYARFIGKDGSAGYTDAPFWALFVFIALLPMTQAVTGIHVNFLAEAVLFMTLPLAMLAAWPQLRESNIAKVLLLMTLLYFGWQLIVTFHGRSRTIPAIYQFLTNLKSFALFVLGFALVWSQRTEKRFWFVIRWVWLYILLFALFQIASPMRFERIFGRFQFIEHSINPLLPFIMRIQGPFSHSSVMATVSVQLALFTIVRAMVMKEPKYWLFTLPYLGLLALSGQRQESFVFIVIVLLGWAVLRFRIGIGRASIVAVLAGGLATALIWPVLGDNIRHEIALWHGGAVSGPEGARAALYSAAFSIASRFAPFGSGLGTYGGPGAAHFDLSMYIDYGLGGYWWFRQGQFLMDSIWACYIAELGWIGAGGLLVIFFTMATFASKTVLSASTPRARMYALAAFLSLAYALLVSPTAFVITDPATGLLSFAFIGVAFRMCRQEAAITVEPRQSVAGLTAARSGFDWRTRAAWRH